MFDIRNMQPLAIASAVLCCFAAAGWGAEPNVTYTATGTFATPAVSGEDVLGLAGQPFTITFVLNEATKPTRHSDTIAEYTNISATLTGRLDAFGAPGEYNYVQTGVSLFLVVGGAGKPDGAFVQFPLSPTGLPVTVTAKAAMPAGTITTPAIRPFTAPVTLTPKNVVVTVVCPACAPPYTGNATTLAVADGP